VLIGSITGTDRNVYLTSIGSGGSDDCSESPGDANDDELECLTDADVTTGRRDEVADNLNALRDEILAMQGTEALPDAESISRRPDTPYLWPIAAVSDVNQATIISGAGGQDAFQSVYDGMGFRFYSALYYHESGVWSGGSSSQATIWARADDAESYGFSHILDVGHGTSERMDIETAIGWLNRTEDSCIGFMISEMNIYEYYTANAGLKASVLDPYVDDFIVPLIDAIADWNDENPTKKKYLYMLMKHNFWVASPAIDDFASRVFDTPEWRAVVVPLVEEGASHAPEQNLMAMVGLWRDGYSPKWMTNVIVDQLTLAPGRQDHTLAEPSPILRHYAASAAMGSFEYRHNLKNFFATGWNFNPTVTKYGNPVSEHPEVCYCDAVSCASPPYDAYPYTRCLNYTDTGLLSMDLFIRLVGLGVIEVPSTSRIVGLNTVVWRVNELNGTPASPPASPYYDDEQLYLWATRNFGVPALRPVKSQWGIFSGFEWPMHPTHADTYAPAYLVGAQRYGHQFIPRTDYGLPVILPGSFAGEEEWSGGSIETDGWRVGSGPPVEIDAGNASTIKSIVEVGFAIGAAELPVRVEGAFGMATKRDAAEPDTETYRVTIMDPAYLDPQAIDVGVYTLDEVVSAVDVVPIDGRECVTDTDTNSVAVHVGAGSICVVDVTVSTAEE
jgi:hypothetical protein